MLRAVFVLSLALLATGCDCSGGGGQPCSSNADCGEGETCRDGRCMPARDAGADDAGEASDAGADASRCAISETACGRTECCGAGELCRFDSCISDLGECTTSDTCWGDSYCSSGRCIPYGVPAGYDHDESCTRAIDIEALVPEVQCRWTTPPADAFADYYQVMSTPIVIDLDLDENPTTLAPSIVFTTFSAGLGYGGRSLLRIIDGATCAHQYSFTADEDATMGPAPPSAGDLDGDGRAEIVAVGQSGGLKAFRYDTTTDTFARIWTSATCDGLGNRTPDNMGGADEWAGPSIHDLDDDGIPEIVYGGAVYDRDGCLITTIAYPPYSQGVVPVLADIDEDGRIELIQGYGIWEYSARAWVQETYFPLNSQAAGQVAVAEMGNFPVAALGRDAPEIVVVSSGAARVQTLDGTVVFGPVTVFGGGSGGPPTIADFDGDGRREFASAGGGAYVVFDLDCWPSGGAGCAMNGILWTQPSQDNSSNVTGSSVFDFDFDGDAEVVYADECFVRVYDGATGTVLYSAARSSGTTYENPVIADVDGDFHSEIVSSVNDYAGTLGCPASDPLFPSAPFATNHGIVVLRDAMDRWAASRPIWNQHAYAVTHVGNRGEIPRTSDWEPNWRDPALNNFRQNVQGDLDALGLADLTAASEEGPLDVLCEVPNIATLPAQICNRGTLPLAAGTTIAFRIDAQDGAELCRAPVPIALTVGMCTQVTCTGALPDPENGHDLYVIVDPDAAERECFEGNNVAVLSDVRCEFIQ
jgi:hypothetical protein